MISPVNPLLPLYLLELVFGMLYALFIHWVSIKHYGRGGTAGSVVVGTAGTLLIQWMFMPTAHTLVTFGSFACSGLPMVLSYMYRYEMRKASHKARPLPNRAARLRDEAMMEISMITFDIAEKDEPPVRVVHRLHGVNKILKGM